MKLIELVCSCTNESSDYIIDCCCPSDYGTSYEKYEKCAGKTCKECWEQGYLYIAGAYRHPVPERRDNDAN